MTQLKAMTKQGEADFLVTKDKFQHISYPHIFHGLRYSDWMHKVWSRYQGSPDEQEGILRAALVRYASEKGHLPESLRVLRKLHFLYLPGGNDPAQKKMMLDRELMEDTSKLSKAERQKRIDACIELLETNFVCQTKFSTHLSTSRKRNRECTKNSTGKGKEERTDKRDKRKREEKSKGNDKTEKERKIAKKNENKKC